MAPQRNAFAPLYVPITNIPSTGIQLRPEFIELFKYANIESSHLITLDDLPDLSIIKSQLPPENTKWILVDHNALQGQLGKIYSDRVGGVIDHHDDEGKTPANTGDEPRIIEKSGSCTSLITEYCRQAWDVLSDSATSSGAAHAQGDSLSDDDVVVKSWDAEVAHLGLASILIDTSNLQSKDKTTEHDKIAAEYLEAKIKTCKKFSDKFDRTKFYETIDAAKKDIGGLILQDILRKDYKQWDEKSRRLGVSSVVKPIEFMQRKAKDEAHINPSTDDAFLSALDRFARERELDMYAVMTTSTSPEGQFRRELLLWAFNDAGVSAAKRFASDSRDELGLEDWQGAEDEGYNSEGDGYWRHIWWQRHVQHSRKRVAPLLRAAIH
ncbi:DHH phosphoesterase [Periconia macrospinosa]|uniref:DHH phosphoesterase n=1 Tax=Periconia macrospinosa TaxID=97972 RepID=A0A2V1E4T8_9PLEO|nr:DHH phosphoesterase [Periconia macrospinosa]